MAVSLKDRKRKQIESEGKDGTEDDYHGDIHLLAESLSAYARMAIGISS